ncbi:MAG: beta galactosidase jelly roll domain-containing protein [Armatimonadota bacterium]
MTGYVNRSHFIDPLQTNPDRGNVHNLRRYRASGWYNKYRIWAETIAGSDASVVLPREMAVALDTDNLAWTRGWHRPDVPVANLERWDTTMPPDIKYGTQRAPAAFFYRTEVDVPPAFAGKNVALFFPSLIARNLRLWVNGTPVTFDHGEYRDENWRGPAYFWSNYNHTRLFDVTPLIRPGEKNTIAFRVFKSYDHGGTYDRVYLLANPPEE